MRSSPCWSWDDGIFWGSGLHRHQDARELFVLGARGYCASRATAIGQGEWWLRVLKSVRCSIVPRTPKIALALKTRTGYKEQNNERGREQCSRGLSIALPTSCMSMQDAQTGSTTRSFRHDEARATPDQRRHPRHRSRRTGDRCQRSVAWRCSAGTDLQDRRRQGRQRTSLSPR